MLIPGFGPLRQLRRLGGLVQAIFMLNIAVSGQYPLPTLVSRRGGLHMSWGLLFISDSQQLEGHAKTTAGTEDSHFLDLQTHLKCLPPLPIGWFLQFVPCFLGLSSFLDLEQLLEACGLSGPNMTYSSRNGVKRAQKNPQTSANLKKCSIEHINLEHFFIARAEIEDSGTNCVFEQKKSEQTKILSMEGPGQLGVGIWVVTCSSRPPLSLGQGQNWAAVSLRWAWQGRNGEHHPFKCLAFSESKLVPTGWGSARCLFWPLSLWACPFLVAPGNLSFLNHLTIIPAIACLDDACLRSFLKPLGLRLGLAKPRAAHGISFVRVLVDVALVLTIAYLSLPVAKNLLQMEGRQKMNSPSAQWIA